MLMSDVRIQHGMVEWKLSLTTIESCDRSKKAITIVTNHMLTVGPLHMEESKVLAFFKM